MSVNQADIPGFPPDHAGLFETTLLQGLDPGLVDIDQLGAAPDAVDRFDPTSPLWGIVGTDPRQTPPLTAAELVDSLGEWLATALG